MSDLVVVGAEYAFGADLKAHPTTWPWADMADPATRPAGTTGRLRTATPVVIRAGRQDEASIVQPSTVTTLLDNSDGRLTPRKASSIWWPHVKRGTPGRLVVPAGPAALHTTGTSGSRASTPDDPSLDVPGDQSWLVELWPPIFLPPPGVNYEIWGKFNPTGNQRSAVLFVSPSGILQLRWSTDGTGAGELNAVPDVAVPIPPWGPLSMGAFLDVNNGSGGRTTTFYALHDDLLALVADPVAAVLDTDTDSGTTSVFSSTAPLDLGDVTGSGFAPYPGVIARARYVAGPPDGADIRANPDFTTLEPGAASHTDSEGRVWSFSGGAKISNRHVRLVGETHSWVPEWPQRNVSGTAQVRVQTAGILRRLRRPRKALHSALRRLILSDEAQADVVAYWPLEDGRDAAVAASPMPGVPAGIVSMAKAADDTLNGSLPVPNAPGGQPGGWNFTIPDHTVTGSKWAIDWPVRVPTGAAGHEPLMVVRTSSTQAREWRLTASATEWRVTVVDANGATTQQVTPLTLPWFFGPWSMLRLEVRQVGGNVDWSWYWVDTTTGTVLEVFDSFAGQIGRATGLANLFASAPPDGISVAHFVVSTGTGSNLGWLAPADSGFIGERAGRRVERLCREEGIPFVGIGDLDDTEPMGPQRALPLATLLEECAAADLGILGEQRHTPGLFFRTRHSLYNQQPKLIIDAGLDNPFTPTEDDQRVRNDVEVTRVNGSSHREVDQEAIDGDELGEGLYDSATQVNVASDTQLPSQAAWRLRQGTWPEMRYPTVPVLLKTPELIEQWLRCGLGDKVRIINLPPEHPTDSVDLIIEGYTETIRPERWDVQLNCSPAGVWDVDVMGDANDLDTSLQRMSHPGSTLGTGIDQDDMSLSLVSTDPTKTLWMTTATHPGHFPIDLELGGEVVTVSAITGTSSPQTATVAQRAVNGVSKSHLAGTPVQVARPFVIPF